MCIVNHPVTAHPGYLIDAPMQSVAAPGALFTRLLAHHRELGLTCEQIMALLDLSREYHERQVAIQLEFARVSEALEIKRGRIDEQAVAKREQLLRRHAELFLEHERLFFESARRGHEILTDEQIERAELSTMRKRMLCLTPCSLRSIGRWDPTLSSPKWDMNGIFLRWGHFTPCNRFLQ